MDAWHGQLLNPPLPMQAIDQQRFLGEAIRSVMAVSNPTHVTSKSTIFPYNGTSGIAADSTSIVRILPVFGGALKLFYINVLREVWWVEQLLAWSPFRWRRVFPGSQACIRFGAGRAHRKAARSRFAEADLNLRAKQARQACFNPLRFNFKCIDTQSTPEAVCQLALLWIT